MWLRLRQIALVARELAPVEKDIIDVLGVAVCYRDPGVATYGLENALFPIGNQLLEVVAPVETETAGGRYLERRGGDGGYMVITQCNDHDPRRARVQELGVRLVTDHDGREYRIMQLHPKDTGGTFFEIDEQLGDNAHDEDGPWHPAGPNWQRAKQTERVVGIVGAEIQCDDPAEVARRWAEIAEIELDGLTVQLENAELRFVSISDGRPEGLSAIDVATNDRQAIIAAAKGINAALSEHQIELCGLRINLV
ncbi:MAG: hypothetical protein GKR90_06510 [Pseudomonadales bacterium]|nr:hypothetical protein [Pseudomonadales bacterium]